jgi:hypothetical protein
MPEYYERAQVESEIEAMLNRLTPVSVDDWPGPYQVNAAIGLNMRSQPLLSGNKIRTLSDGERVTVYGAILGDCISDHADGDTACDDVWYIIQDADHRLGYAHSAYLEPANPNPPPPVTPALAGSRLGVHTDCASRDIGRFLTGKMNFALFNCNGGNNLPELVQFLTVNPAATAIVRSTALEIRIQDNEQPGDPWQRGWNHWQTTFDNIAQYIPAELRTRCYFMGVNEPAREHAAWWNDFETSRAIAAHEDGCHIAAFAFSVGTPDYPDWAYYMPCLMELNAGGDMLCLHEYFGHAVDDLWDADSGAFPDGYGHLCGRFIWVWENVLVPAGLIDIEIGIGECGADDVKKQVPGSGAWRWPWRLGGPMTEERYLENMARYDALLKRFYERTGKDVRAALYGLGFHNGAEWQFHNIENCEDHQFATRFANYINTA